MQEQLISEISTEAELPALAARLLHFAGDLRVFLFEGEMGSGKTTFIKAVCRQLGTDESLSSPTYSIVNEYSFADGKKIFHFDLYRLKNQEECLSIGLEEYLDSGHYCFIEWPQVAGSLLPDSYILIKITETANQRCFLFDKVRMAVD